jgi:hypothetical protein
MQKLSFVITKKMDQKVRYLKNSKETREGGNLMKKHRESIVIKSDPGLT